MTRAALAAIVLGIAAGSAAPAASNRDPLAGRIAGKPVDCIDHSRQMGPEIVDDRTILYRESSRRIWRNDLPEQCRGLRPFVTLIVEIHGSQLCRNDNFRLIEPESSIPTGFCRLGSFTPYDKPAR